MPVPWAIPIGRLSRIQLRTPVTEMAVNSTPIRKTAPSATGMEICCPSTRLKAVKAVSEMAQPMAIGSLAQSPISSEPKPATRQVATNTAPGKTRLAEHAGHHDHRIDHGEEGGEPRQHLLAHVAAPLADHEVAIERAAGGLSSRRRPLSATAPSISFILFVWLMADSFLHP